MVNDKKIDYIFNQILYSLFTFSVTFFAARFMKIEDFGEFSYAYSFLPLLNIVPLAFVYFPMMNFYAKWKTKDTSYLFNNALINLVLSVLLVVVLLGILIISGTLSGYIILFLTFYFFTQSYEFFRRLFIVKEEIKLLNKIEITKLLLFLSLITVLILSSNFHINYLIVALIILMVIVNFLAYKKAKLTAAPLTCVSDVLQESYGFGKWIFLSNIIQNLSSNLFIYLSGFLLTAEAIARLNAPKLFLGLTTVFLLSIDNYYTPKIAANRVNNKTNYLSALKQIVKELQLFYLAFFILSILVIYFQDFVIQLVFGTKFLGGENYLWGFIIVGLIYALMRPFLILFRVYEMTKFLFKSSVWVFIIVVLITYPLMNLYGALGGLIAMIIGNMIQLLFYLSYLKKIW